jgi:ribose-phosphate pyrophosphokinase
MIKLDGKIVYQEHFPDNSLRIDPINDNRLDLSFMGMAPSPKKITWHYENDAELFTVICLRKHFANKEMILDMPYCPHARMDRVKNNNEFFTLKYFADVINGLGFSEVRIYDPHSNVCTALINNVKAICPYNEVQKTIKAIDSTNLIAFYPDEGAMKRGIDYLAGAYAFGIKRRDWATGKILALELMNKEVVNGKDVLIIDDICSRGGTFYHSAKALKEAGARNIYLYVTHCENTIFEGDLLTSGLIKKVYTTNSIFTGKHEKIEVFEL